MNGRKMLKIEKPYHFGWKVRFNERGDDKLPIPDGTHQEIDLDTKVTLDITIYKGEKEVYWLKKIESLGRK